MSPFYREACCDPAGVEFISANRGYRCAQPPANCLHPFGMKRSLRSSPRLHHSQIRDPFDKTPRPGSEGDSAAGADAAAVAAVGVEVQFDGDPGLETGGGEVDGLR